MIGQRELTFEDYKAISRRRIWVLIIPVVLCAAGAYGVSRILPSRYTSETVVLVEEPAVPENFVKSVVSGDLGQRLASMQEQILSRTRLQQIIEKFGLYKEDSHHPPAEELIVRLRESIKVVPLTPMAQTSSKQLPGFTVSVVARRPELAQQICTEITTIFMQQNALFRKRRAEDTTEFLTKQLEEAKARLNEQDARLADFKRRYIGALPDDTQTNLSILAGMASQLEAVTQALNRAQQEKVFVESMLSQQIAAGKLTQTAGDPEALQKHLATLQNELRSLQARYTDEHPDVIKAKNDITQLRKKMQEEAVNSGGADKSGKAALSVETPQIQQLRAQLHQVETTIRQRSIEQSRIQQEIGRLQGKLQLSPAVEQEYKALTRDYQTALGISNDLLKKQSDSEMATDLERQQQGEQFRVLDPPSLPQRPTFPNRPLFGLGGLAGGLAIGFAIAFFQEAQDRTLRTDRDVEVLLKLPTLAMIQSFEPAKANRRNGVPKSGLERASKPVIPGIGV
jgi:polysaccharide chain length determinant protein (PEP-CTERM system associated)